MAIIKDEKRGVYYISFKYKMFDGSFKTTNIRNKSWKLNGVSKVSLKYMKAIEDIEIRKKTQELNTKYEREQKVSVGETFELFCKVMQSEGIDVETIKYYEMNMKNYYFKVVSEDTPCDEAFEPALIDDYKIKLKENGLNEQTINHRYNIIRKVIDFARSRKIITREYADEAIDLLKPLRTPKKELKENFFSNGKEDADKFIATFDTEDKEYRVPILTLFYGALRIGEFQGLKVKFFDKESGTLLIVGQVDPHGNYKSYTKTRSERVVKLPDLFVSEVQKYIEENKLLPNDYLFFGVKKDHIARTTIRRIVDKHLKLADLPHITIHGLRHSFATRMFDNGYDIREVQKQLGHSNMETTMKYYIHYTNSKRKKDFNDLL